jgi:hypothetical protein
MPWRSATVDGLHDELVRVGGDVGARIDAGQLELIGATSLCWVLAVTPMAQSSSLSSRMKAATFSGMAPK